MNRKMIALGALAVTAALIAAMLSNRPNDASTGTITNEYGGDQTPTFKAPDSAARITTEGAAPAPAASAPVATTKAAAPAPEGYDSGLKSIDTSSDKP